MQRDADVRITYQFLAWCEMKGRGLTVDGTAICKEMSR